MPDGFIHPEFLVEPEWLASHLADPAVRIFDCTTHLIPDPKITYQVVGTRRFRSSPYSWGAVH